jgi:hypothetical protein
MFALAPSLVNLPFRGDRLYLHSTDLYPALAEFAHQQFSADAFVDRLTIRKAVNHQVRVNLDNSDKAFGNFRVRDRAKQTTGWLIEGDEPILSRIPFDEVTPMKEAICGPGFARLNRLLPKYSAFELLVILAKIVSSQQNSAHWLICQIEFYSPMREVAPLECRFSRQVSDHFQTLLIYQAGKVIASASGIADHDSRFTILGRDL